MFAQYGDFLSVECWFFFLFMLYVLQKDDYLLHRSLMLLYTLMLLYMLKLCFVFYLFFHWEKNKTVQWPNCPIPLNKWSIIYKQVLLWFSAAPVYHNLMQIVYRLNSWILDIINTRCLISSKHWVDFNSRNENLKYNTMCFVNISQFF